MEIKICTKCGDGKIIEDFSFKNTKTGKRSSNCRACQKIMSDAYYQKNRKKHIAQAQANRKSYYQWWRDFKSTLACEQCGENHPATIDFHHVGDKEIGVALAVHQGWGKERVLAEVAKCKVLCANCHRKHHWHPR